MLRTSVDFVLQPRVLLCKLVQACFKFPIRAHSMFNVPTESHLKHNETNESRLKQICTTLIAVAKSVKLNLASAAGRT